MGWALVGSLPIYGSRGGNDDPFHIESRILGQKIVKEGRSAEIHLFVLSHLVHRLAGTSFSGEVDHGLMTGERRLPDGAFTNVAANETNLMLKICRQVAIFAVYLGTKIVNYGHRVAG